MLIAPRIEASADTCGGKARIAGTRVRVTDILEMLGGGMTPEEIVGDYPYISDPDIRAALNYAARQVARPVSFDVPAAAE